MKKLIALISLLLIVLTVNLLAAKEEKMSGEMMASERAIFAGGCFWCMESAMEHLDGVEEAISGYTGGKKLNPTYKEVSAGITGHTEAVEVHYDPHKISYSELLDAVWMNINPTDAGGQFVDRGQQYRSGIFYLNENQRRLAEESKQKLAESGRFGKPLVTEITKAGVFYPAEEYHQDYYSKNPLRYRFYTSGSGRKSFLKKAWGD